MDVKTAFLNAPVVTPDDTTIIVRVLAILRAAGVCQEKYWRVNKALYGPTLSNLACLPDGAKIQYTHAP